MTGGCESAHQGAFSGAGIGALSGLAIGSLSGNAGRVLGCERSNPSVHKNYSMFYSSHLSWSSPTTPTPLELYPALAFDRCSRTPPHPATKACSVRCRLMRRTCVAASAPATNASLTSISIPGATWRSASRSQASAANCQAGGRRSTNQT